MESILGAGFGKPIPPVAKADKPWHTAKIALISAVLWVPTGIVMMVRACLPAPTPACDSGLLQE